VLERNRGLELVELKKRRPLSGRIALGPSRVWMVKELKAFLTWVGKAGVQNTKKNAEGKIV